MPRPPGMLLAASFPVTLNEAAPSHVEPFRRTPALKQKFFCSLGLRSRAWRSVKSNVVGVASVAEPLPRQQSCPQKE